MFYRPAELARAGLSPRTASALARNDPTLLTEPDPGNPPAAGMISLSLPSTCERRAGFVRWVTLFEQKWVILAERRGRTARAVRPAEASTRQGSLRNFRLLT